MPKLSSLDVLTDYRPRVPLRVYAADGYLIREIVEERRAAVKIENIPRDSPSRALRRSPCKWRAISS
jgi:penicillin-binding protein 1A